jgi:hypothetical protein
MTNDIDSEISELRAHIDAMLKVASTGRGRIRAHLLCEVDQVMSRMLPKDLTDAELAALIAVMHAAHARAITHPTGERPVLRIIPRATGK